jgi:SAM-dependent methyltransferase
VWGVDIAHGMIDQCSRTFGDRPNAHFSLGRIEKLEFPDGFFDVVVCLGVVEYLIDDSVAIQEMHRVLRPGGLAVISCPNYWSPWRRWDALYWRIAVPVRKMLGREPYSEMIHREYRQGAYCGLLEKHGFRVEDVAYYNFKTIPTPIDRKLVKLSLGISRRLEGQSRGLLKRLATGFNVAVRKPAESAPAPAAPAAG